MSVASLTGSYAIDGMCVRLLARHVPNRATGRGLRALGLFYSPFRNFGRLLPLEAGIGRALCGRSVRSFLQSSRGSERLWHDI
ncbi:hypothetical protein SAMN04488032_1363 [Pacificibacter marinus]|uniref:Uncharacterized protein n=1 Tax=Pacificibacter marinus TaxID=658057 RepID=A0A1Y5TWR9_9RHOB|nr:hypothetical protein SAMN04488032_1363 [Pacificibacter marinus]SLN71854.1 hypothetical protein PAM7971_03846 [Pacificibacter marinus]